MKMNKSIQALKTDKKKPKQRIDINISDTIYKIFFFVPSVVNQDIVCIWEYGNDGSRTH